jgi:hypothetical protein
MNKIPDYAHYYMSEVEILELKKKEIEEVYSKKGYSGLSEIEKEWYHRFFPLIVKKEVNNGKSSD